MSDVKISGLPIASTPILGPELLPIVQSGTTKQATVNQLNTFFTPNYVQIQSQGRFSPGGRLTIDSGDPIPDHDFAAQSTLYYTPFRHNNIFTDISGGGNWQRQTFSEISLSLSGLTTGKNYDVFINFNATVLSLSNAWTSDTVRTDAIGTQDGTPVLASDHTKLWLGTIRASSATTTEDTGGGSSSQVGGQRFVYNAYNQAPRFASVIDTTATWSYLTATIRQANAAAGNKIEYVTGDSFTQIDATIDSTVSLVGNSAREATVGVGIDSTTTFSGLVPSGFTNITPSALNCSMIARYIGFANGLGYHSISWNESGADGTTCTFVGKLRNVQSGMTVVLFN